MFIYEKSSQELLGQESSNLHGSFPTMQIEVFKNHGPRRLGGATIGQ
jgi:hypothetical protein